MNACLPTVVLVDGTYELFRSFYGAPRETHKHQEIGAIRGLLRSFRKLLQSHRHVAVAFDHVIESFRNDLFDGYKRGDGIDPDLWSQFPLAEEATAALGLVGWPMVEFEADDALATAAHTLACDPAVGQIAIASPDKDLAQCVRGTRVLRWDRRKDEWLDEAGVTNKYGVPPEAIPSFLALVGDAADGIPGIPGFGAKTAAALLAHYRTLDAIPDSAEAWEVNVRGKARLAETLSGRREDARLYRELATLRLDVPLDLSHETLAWRGPSTGLRAFCERIGDVRFAEMMEAAAG